MLGGHSSERRGNSGYCPHKRLTCVKLATNGGRERTPNTMVDSMRRKSVSLLHRSYYRSHAPSMRLALARPNIFLQGKGLYRVGGDHFYMLYLLPLERVRGPFHEKT